MEKTLTLAQMDVLCDNLDFCFDTYFKNADTIVGYELDSKNVYSSIRIIYPNDNKYKNAIIHTLGMSTTIMSNGRRCEIFIGCRKNIILEFPDCEIEELTTVTSIINSQYQFIFDDLIKISKMITIDKEIYKNTDTVEVDGRIYVLWKAFEFNGGKDFKYNNIDVFSLILLSYEELLSLKKIKDFKKRCEFISELFEECRWSISSKSKLL